MKGLFLLYISFIMVAAVGWCLNIYQIANSNFNDITGILVLKTIGVFIAPLGGLLGYIGLI